MCALYGSFALRSNGVGVLGDDVLGHFLIARWVWSHPELLLNTWGRPAFAAVYAPVALLGLPAVRLWSAVLAAAACVGTARLAQSYGVRLPWLAALFAGLGPEWVRQGFAGLTELVAACCLCAALLGVAERRAWLAALGAGLTPLARYELLPVVALLLAALMWQRRWRYAGATLLPWLFWNVGNAVVARAWLPLVFPFDRLWAAPAGTAFDYGTGPIWHYVALLPDAFGGAALVLALLGAVRLRMGLLHGVALLVLAVLSIGYWAVPTLGIAGYARHLAVLAPVVGMLAAAGIEHLSAPVVRPWQRLAIASLLLAVFGWFAARGLYADAVIALGALTSMGWFSGSAVFARGLAALAVLVLLASTLQTVRPNQLSGEQAQALAAGQWFRASAFHTKPVLVSHVWFTYGSGGDPFDRAVVRPITPPAIDVAPIGSIIVWDSHYSPRLVWQTPRALVQNNPHLRLIRSWTSGRFQLDVYEKVAP